MTDMVLVDTSIWIDFFQSPDSNSSEILASLIKDHNRIALCGMVLQEVLQGIRDSRSFELVRERLLKFPYVEADKDTWLLAASMYRQLRAVGLTLPSADVTIAATAMRHDMQLFSLDTHFNKLAELFTLKLFAL